MPFRKRSKIFLLLMAGISSRKICGKKRRVASRTPVEAVIMRSVLLCLLTSAVLATCALSEENDEEMEVESMNQLLETLDFVGGDDFRSDDGEECIARNHDCTTHRHRCCRSKFFKDKCKCFYVEGGNGSETEEEFCTCQQEWYLGMTEQIYERASALLGKWFG